MSNYGVTPDELPQDAVGQPTRPIAWNEPAAPPAAPSAYGQAPNGHSASGMPPYGQAPYGQGGSSMLPYGQAPYGRGYALNLDPSAPWGIDQATGLPFSDKSRTTAGLLQILLAFLGICGIGRLYSGHIAIGLLQLLGMLVSWVLMLVAIGFLLVPAIWLWTVIDGILMLTGNVRDISGRRLRP